IEGSHGAIMTARAGSVSAIRCPRGQCAQRHGERGGARSALHRRSPMSASETTNATPLRQRPAWTALEKHHAQVRDVHLRELFAGDPTRGERLAAEGAGLYLDYSKNRVTGETLGLLVQLAEQCGLAERRDAMFRGERINVSENRAVLHVALRQPRGASLILDGADVVAHVHEVLDRMAAFADRVRSGEWKGHTGKAIRNVVNIGIGGSDLGPVMAYEAL